MSSDNWWQCPRSSGQFETRGESTWPGLSPSRRRPPRRRGRVVGENVFERTRDQARSADRSSVLDDEGYPKLGQKFSKRKLPGTEAQAQTPRPGCSDEIELGKLNVDKTETSEPDIVGRQYSKKRMRTNLIRIDLEKVLERQRSLSESQTSSSPKPRIKLNLNLSIRNPLDSDRVIQCRKGKQREVPRPKRISKLKTVIFRDRECRKERNIWKRELFDLEKIQAITKDVSGIDFNRLKISGETKPEVTFVSDMSRMTLFDKKYRKPSSDNLPDDPIPDTNSNVVNRLQSLLIERDCLGDISPELEARQETLSENEIEFLDSNILMKTLCLKICDETGETVQEFGEPEARNDTNLTTEEITVSNSPKHSRNFREYCTNYLTPGLNVASENFLAEIYRLQRRMYQRDEVKGRNRRRFYAGFKEVIKHVESKKIKFVIVAPDLEGTPGYPGGLDEFLTKLIAVCKIQEVVFCFALSKRKLGYYTHKKGSVGCVGVTNYSGLEEKFKQVLTELMLARNSYESGNPPGESGRIFNTMNPEGDETLISTRINLLFKALTINNS